MSDAESVRPDRLPPPQFTSGQIIFHCPKGHRLVVKEAYAGKRGRCDKQGCGAAVVVPVPPPAVAVDEDAPEPEVEPVEAPVAASPAGGTAAAHVEAAAVAAGPAEESVTDERVPSEADGWGFIGSGVLPGDAVVEGEAAAPAAGAYGSAAGTEPFGNPVARLVARLWEERDHGGIVELHLASGSVVLPEWYDHTWSRGTHGLFASQAPDGTLTLTAVAWDAIQKVVVRQVRDMPAGMFE
jgi:hypothetical protein